MDAQADLRLCCYISPTTVFLSHSQIVVCHFIHERLKSKMRNLIFVKNDTTQTELLIAQSLQSICSAYVDTLRVILLVTFFLYESKHGYH